MFSEKIAVDNRVFLLGLDQLYRKAMKLEERGELLTCVRRVADTLHIRPADVPVEGYYSEDPHLTEYFCLLRALQEVGEASKPAVASLPDFHRILDVVSSRLYGRAQHEGKLLPEGRDALSQALFETRPGWELHTLVRVARAAAQEMDDYSLVGLAAQAQDAVVLTAVRESVVLYAERVVGAALSTHEPRYVWKVDKDLSAQAQRFVETFNRLFGDKLPAPEPSNAEIYWHAYSDNKILGRCVRLGYDDSTSPIRHYHWGVCREAGGEYGVQEFWHSEIWTTDRYRLAIHSSGRRLER